MSKQYNTKLQERLEKFLKDENLSQAKAAPILGISQAALSQYRRSMYDKYCIYLAVVEPDLRAVAMELKDQGEIKTYPEVVDIFEMNEITSIATEIMKLSGVIGSKKVTVVEEQKNS